MSVNGGDAFCMLTVLILAAGMSINSLGSGLEAFTVPHMSLPSKPASTLLSGFGAQRRRGKEHVSRKPRNEQCRIQLMLFNLIACLLPDFSLAPARLTAQLCQGAALWMLHKVWSPPPKQVCLPHCD